MVKFHCGFHPSLKIFFCEKLFSSTGVYCYHSKPWIVRVTASETVPKYNAKALCICRSFEFNVSQCYLKSPS